MPGFFIPIKKRGTIAAGGEEYLVFNSFSIVIRQNTHLLPAFMTCKPGKCDLEMTRIRYWYDEARDGGEKYVAEEWITDDMALTSQKPNWHPSAVNSEEKQLT